VLADDEVQLRVIRHAVAFVRGALDLDDAAPCIPSPAYIARHIREQKIVIDRMPDRSLGEFEARADLADRRIGINQGFEFRA